MHAAIGPEQLAAERKHLYLYAMVKLRDADLAEDAVQETLIAAIEALPNFQGRSALRTWLVAILRNKIADLVQARGRLVSVEGEHDDESMEEALESLFDRQGMWDRDQRPRAWEDPERALQQQQFWTVFELCLRVLPAKTAEVFTLREVFGEAIESICKNLGITATNCSVMLYRARMRLRTCLDEKWFSGAGRV